MFGGRLLHFRHVQFQASFVQTHKCTLSNGKPLFRSKFSSQYWFYEIADQILITLDHHPYLPSVFVDDNDIILMAMSSNLHLSTIKSTNCTERY